MLTVAIRNHVWSLGMNQDVGKLQNAALYQKARPNRPSGIPRELLSVPSSFVCWKPGVAVEGLNAVLAAGLLLPAASAPAPHDEELRAPLPEHINMKIYIYI